MNYNMEHMRKLARLSTRAAWQVMLLPAVGRGISRSAGARAVARLCGTQHDDCGECMKLCVRFALQEGCPSEVVEALLDRHPERLPEDLRLVYDLCQAALEARPEATELSRRVEERLGKKILADVAVNLAGSRTYPTLKRALGVATTECLTAQAILS